MPDVKKTEENNFPLYLFHEGTNVKAYEYMGLHKAAVDGGAGMSCRVWRPTPRQSRWSARSNEWDEEKNPMEKISDGVWECYLPFVLPMYEIYKFSITGKDGKKVMKSDPYAFHFEAELDTLPAIMTSRDSNGTIRRGTSTRKKSRITTSCEHLRGTSRFLAPVCGWQCLFL